MWKCVLAALPITLLPAQQPGAEFFEKKIRPVLVEKCYGCHSASAKPVQGGVLLDSSDGTLRARHALPAAIKKMPPGAPLSPEVAADFKAWLDLGAPDPRAASNTPAPASYDFAKARQHWSFRPVADPPPPTAKDPLWNQIVIDRFIAERREAKGLRPTPLADKRTLIRRATYDLTGLPPTPAEVSAFLADASAGAFEKLVDRLLDTRQYAERWGRHWLDVVRYADTAGCNSDFPVPDLYRYRNWVIQAFQRDQPYMEFLRDQIAGDLTAPSGDEDRQAKIVATTYIGLSRRFASSKNEHFLTIDDTVDNVGKAMLGLSLSCARCHDHKYDPIPQRDYFGIYGIFESTVYAFPGVETFPRPHDFIALGGPEDQKKLTAWETQVKTIHDQIRELRFGAGRNKPNAREEVEKLRGQVLGLEMAPPTLAKAYAVRDGAPVNTKMHFKGDPKKTGETAPRGWLTILGGGKVAEGKESGRRQLAAWITDRANPLTARVMTNRIWQWHFGKGLVTTPNDFGSRGQPPTHPELLDWLTSRFAESGYSVKKMHKLLMLTRAYRLSGAHDPANAAKDPSNAYLWRFDRRRLEAEEVRDSMLAVSGQLDPAPGGAHPFPPLHQWTYSQHRQFFATYDHDKRSVYLMQQRLRRHPLLELFDAADPNASTGVRNSNVTALQALSLMNSEFVHTQADQLAVRVGMAHADTAGRIRYAHQLAFARTATPDEIREGAAYLASAQAALAGSTVPEERRPRAALASYVRALLASDEFFFVD